MRQTLVILLVFVGFIVYGQDTVKPTWSVKWDNSTQISSSDGKFKIKFGGRIQFDIMAIEQNATLDEEFDALNGAEFRRLRFFSAGTLYGNIKYKLQFDFAAGDAGVKDAYIEVIKIPVVGNFRVGHFKQPFGFEMQTSSKYIEFMERGYTNAFTPERDLGLMIFNHEFNKRLGWYAGYFFPSGTVGKYLGNQYRYTLRLVGLPVYKTTGRYTVLHIGVAYEHQYQDNQELTLNQRPEAHMAPKYLNLNIENVDRAEVLGGEIAFVSGPFTLQAEYMDALITPSVSNITKLAHYNYYAYYALFSWFITGEHRNYSQSSNCFDIVKPKKNFGDGGAGAWEVAVRYSYIDLGDKDLTAGMMNGFTLGMNWWVNPATRFTFNYIYADVVDTGYANIAMVRFQVAF